MYCVCVKVLVAVGGKYRIWGLAVQAFRMGAESLTNYIFIDSTVASSPGHIISASSRNVTL